MATLWSVAQPVIIVSYYCDEILSFFVNAFLNARKDQIEKVATLKCYGVYFYGLQYELKIGKNALIYRQGSSRSLKIAQWKSGTIEDPMKV